MNQINQITQFLAYWIKTLRSFFVGTLFCTFRSFGLWHSRVFSFYFYELYEQMRGKLPSQGSSSWNYLLQHYNCQKLKVQENGPGHKELLQWHHSPTSGAALSCGVDHKDNITIILSFFHCLSRQSWLLFLVRIFVD